MESSLSYKPSLVDPSILSEVKISKSPNQKREFASMFAIFDKKYSKNVSLVFMVVFFILVGLFLYFRYKNKKQQREQYHF